jgi:uncharacterized protein YqfA (UPF0365 family)
VTFILLDILAQIQVGTGRWIIVAVVVVILVVIVAMFFILQFISLWLQAFMSNAHVSIYDLIGMRFRKVNARTIVSSRIRAVKAGLSISINDLETHYLAGGQVSNVILSLVAADRARIDLSFRTACAIDLAGRDMLDAIRTSVTPKVIDCPDPSSGRTTIDGVAKDGIQVKARALVTVRTSIERLVGGATEETIIARVGEGIVTSIGSSLNYKVVLANPDMISKTVLGKGLDSGTAFEILSIDIADLDVGTNIGAQLQADQAEADTRRFQAEAEQRAAMARARKAEMTALVREYRAKVVEAEAAVPFAMAGAFRNGNF